MKHQRNDNLEPMDHPRPMRRGGVTFEVETGYGKLFVTINSWSADGTPQEIFAATSRANPETSVQIAALCRLASRALQAGLPPEEIIASWRGLAGASVVWSTVASPILPPGDDPEHPDNLVTRQIRSLPDALGVVLELYEKERKWLLAQGESIFQVHGVEHVGDDEVLHAAGEGSPLTAAELRSRGYEIVRIQSAPQDQPEAASESRRAETAL